MLDLLLRAGANVNAQPSRATKGFARESITSLQYATSLQWPNGVQRLLDYGAAIDAVPPYPDDNAHSALGWAIYNQDCEMIELLFHNNADPNAPATNYENAPSAFLFALARKCSLESFQLFLKQKSDITQVWGKESALEVAVNGRDVDVVQAIMDLMLPLPGDIYSNAMKRVLGIINVGSYKPTDFDLVKMLIEAGADTNATSVTTGKTLLQRLLDDYNIERVKLLLGNGAEVNISAAQNIGTPLQVAILRGQMDIANLLIEHGADINAPPATKKGATALQAAAIGGYCRLARQLLENGADVAAASSPISGRTAIDRAAEHGRLDMLQLLLNAYGEEEDLSPICHCAAFAAEGEGHSMIAGWLRGYPQSRGICCR